MADGAHNRQADEVAALRGRRGGVEGDRVAGTDDEGRGAGQGRGAQAVPAPALGDVQRLTVRREEPGGFLRRTQRVVPASRVQGAPAHRGDREGGQRG